MFALGSRYTTTNAAKHSILFVSREADEFLAHTRCEVLNRAGYRTVQANGLTGAIARALDLRPELVILEHSFAESEQANFIEALQEAMPDVHVLCLRRGQIHPESLLEQCHSIFASQPGGRRIHGSSSILG